MLLNFLWITKTDDKVYTNTMSNLIEVNWTNSIEKKLSNDGKKCDLEVFRHLKHFIKRRDTDLDKWNIDNPHT